MSPGGIRALFVAFWVSVFFWAVIAWCATRLLLSG